MGTIDDGRGFIANYLSPVNTLIFFTTGVLIPLLDFLRPKTSLISYAAAVAVLFFVVLLVLKRMGKTADFPATGPAPVGPRRKGFCSRIRENSDD